MQASHVLGLLPLLIVAGSAVLVMGLVAVRRNHLGAAATALLGMMAAAASIPVAATAAPVLAGGMLRADGLGYYFVGVVLVACFTVALFGFEYLERRSSQNEEFYILVLLAGLGGSVLAMSAHLAAFWLGLEILSASLFGLIAYLRGRYRGLEAGLKYLVLAAAASAFLLFGMALIYADVGAMDFAAIARALRGGRLHTELVVPGVALMTVGIGFKLAVAPFHMWTPDVYEGAPAPTSMLVATASKASIVAVLLRLYLQLDLGAQPAIYAALWAIAAASMFAGNLLALMQDNLKRLLAYSSIAHLGYVLVAVVSGGAAAASAASFYMGAYVATMLGAFGVVCALGRDGAEAERLEDYRGMFWRRPLLAAGLTIALMSLAGIPLTAGFWAKLYVLSAGAAASHWVLVVLVVINSAIALYYYLRVVVMMFDKSPGVPERHASPMGAGFSGALALLILGIGLFPNALTRLIGTAFALL